MKKRVPISNEQGPVTKDKLSEGYPNLVMFLTDAKWDDGSARETGTVLLFCQEGRWKACLNDRDAEASTFVSAITLGALLAALDDAIDSPVVEWRSTGQRKRR